MKIFVTGGAGFIGRHLVESLLEDSHYVTIYDNLSKSNEEKISHLLKKGAEFIKGDTTDLELVSKSLSNNYDSVVHLAAKTRVIDSIKNPEEFHHNNVTGTLRVLIGCKENSVQNVVTASSGAVYGDLPHIPFKESDETKPLSPYCATKLALEYYLKSFSYSYDMNCVALRFSNVYGQGQSIEYAGVITKFIDNIRNKKPLIIYGDGTNSRDFVSVHDVVSGIKLALKNIDGKKGSVYNIATCKSTTVKELAEILLKISKSDLELVFDPPRKGEIKHSKESIELAQTELNYQPKVLLENGIKDLLTKEGII